MPGIVWLNGDLSPLETATTSVADHAHLYGDGVFEGIRIYHHKIFKLDEHLERLYHGVAYLGFKMTLGSKELRATILEVCKLADVDTGYIRLNVTRGTGLGVDPKGIPSIPNVMVMVSTLNLFPSEAYEHGVSAVISPIRVIPADSLDPRVKCIGRYASSILAKHLANRQGAGDAIMLNHQGYVAEGTAMNLFIVKDRVLGTPLPASGILEGITRNTVIVLAREAGYKVVEEFLTPFDVISADECFFTGTAAEVMPMTSLEGRDINLGAVGQVTQDIMSRFKAHTNTGTPF
jgi:branched-chain amino acid aminotransferase